MKLILILEALALLSITGGTITIGALVAPVLFQNLDRADAGLVMLKSFEKFDSWINVSAILLTTAFFLELVFVQGFSYIDTIGLGEEAVSKIDWALLYKTLLVVACSGLSYYLSNILGPLVTEAYDKSKQKEFDALHDKSEQLHRFNFVIGLLLLFTLLA